MIMIFPDMMVFAVSLLPKKPQLDTFPFILIDNSRVTVFEKVLRQFASVAPLFFVR